MSFRSEHTPEHALSLRVAVLASVSAVGLTLWSYLVAERPATAGSVIDCIAALAAIWGTKYVGDGFFSQRDAVERSLAPVLYCFLDRSSDADESDVWFLEVHNAGTSAAVAISGEVRILNSITGRLHKQNLGIYQRKVESRQHARFSLIARQTSVEHEYVEVAMLYDSALRVGEKRVWRFLYHEGELSRSPER
jgi:hypothetical protein